MEKMSERAELALDTLHQRPTRGIPTWLLNPMAWRMIDRLAGVPEGTYREDPVATYRTLQIESRPVQHFCFVGSHDPRGRQDNSPHADRLDRSPSRSQTRCVGTPN